MCVCVLSLHHLALHCVHSVHNDFNVCKYKYIHILQKILLNVLIFHSEQNKDNAFIERKRN